MPLASTTYYFSSLEELMEAATALLIEREAEALARVADSVAGLEASVEEGIEALIAIQSALLREQPAAQIAQFELYLRLARSDRGPQPWTEPYLDVARQLLTRLGSPDPEYHAQTAQRARQRPRPGPAHGTPAGFRRPRPGPRDTRVGPDRLQRRTMTWRAYVARPPATVPTALSA